MPNFSKVTRQMHKLFLICSTGIGVFALCGCSDDNRPIKIQNVDDEVKIKVSGIENSSISDNVDAYLGNLPSISAKRAGLYRREIIELVGEALKSYGYYKPKINIEFPDADAKESKSKLFASPVVKVNVDPGKPIYIRNCDIEILGEGAYYKSFENIIKNSYLKSYTVLNHGYYSDLKQALKEKAMALGFFDAKLIISKILVYEDQNAADIVVVYDTGKRYSIGEILTDDESMELLKPSLSLLEIASGSNYSSEKISDTSSALSKTNYYRSVDVTPIVDKRENGRVPVRISLAKQANNLYRIGIGISSDEKLRGIFSWDKPLINEYGHSFSSYFRVSKIKQDAVTIYKIPRKNPNLDYYYFKLSQNYTDFNDTRSNLSHASFHYVANMTGVWRRDYYISCEYEDFNQGGEIGYKYNVMPGLLFSRRVSSGGMYPAVGYSFSIDSKFGTRIIGSQNFFRSVLTFKGVFSPTEETRVLYRLTQGAILGQDALRVPASMRFFVGGENSLRGFSYMSKSDKQTNGKLKGSRYMTSGSIEYMFPIGIADAKGAVFVDSAICTDSYSDNHSMFVGPGVGFRYITKYGVAKIDLGYGIDNKNDSRGFKLHLSFGPEF